MFSFAKKDLRKISKTTIDSYHDVCARVLIHYFIPMLEHLHNTSNIQKPETRINDSEL